MAQGIPRQVYLQHGATTTPYATIQSGLPENFAHPRTRGAREDVRNSQGRSYRAFVAGEHDFLLGTQMVAKGLDFPDVTVVGVLNADTALHHPYFRASERCFDLIAQVSGRAGRGPKGGRVFVQTWLPHHPAIAAAVRHDYSGFAERELEQRAAFGYPPCGRVVRVTCEGSRADRANRAAARGGAGVEVLGPAPHPVERLRGR
jgi:primosomal protein N' (replication factor Y)